MCRSTVNPLLLPRHPLTPSPPIPGTHLCFQVWRSTTRAESPTTLQPRLLNLKSKKQLIRPVYPRKDVHCTCRCSYLQPFRLFSQMDHDPKNPSYIATQGPLAHTVSDFWQVSMLGLLCHFLSRLVVVKVTPINDL